VGGVNVAVTVRPRSLANVLADIREARSDWTVATAAVLDGEDDADDRVNEAETRLDDLREDFATRLLEATGLTTEQMRDAYAEALI
jgi:uncharacterized damage-inducible protein DinB